MVDEYDNEEVVNVETDLVDSISLLRDNLPGWSGRSNFTLEEYKVHIEVAKMVQKERHFLHMQKTMLEE